MVKKLGGVGGGGGLGVGWIDLEFLGIFEKIHLDVNQVHFKEFHLKNGNFGSTRASHAPQSFKYLKPYGPLK